MEAGTFLQTYALFTPVPFTKLYCFRTYTVYKSVPCPATFFDLVWVSPVWVHWMSFCMYVQKLPVTVFDLETWNSVQIIQVSLLKNESFFRIAYFKGNVTLFTLKRLKQENRTFSPGFNFQYTCQKIWIKPPRTLPKEIVFFGFSKIDPLDL